ncbi:MAG: beta-ketoacyl-ACP synthase II [Calditrichia bacterium]|nr:beta-ketoacyl-ACP synthase II [Calditrichia bacterium]
MQRRVVITGMGAITPVGLNVEETWNSMLAGKSGVELITKFDTSEFTTKIAAEVKGFDPLNHFEKKELRRLDPYTQFALVSANEAITSSQIDFEKEDKTRVGVIVGSGIGGMLSFETELRKLVELGPKRISPFFIPQMISDIAAGQISIKYGLKGPNYATVSACATSGHAIGAAFETVKRGDAEIMVCGGSEAAITPMGIGGFNAMKALSTRNDDPSTASRPFELNRDGFVMGEGAGILLIEELDHAIKRNAKIIAEIAGIGFTADAFHLTQPAPEGEGAVRAMRQCIADGNLTLENIQYINAHGTSTHFNDKNETMAIKTVFGEFAESVLISATKSMTGHLLGSAGAVEGIVSVLSIVNNTIPPTINYQTPDPECDLNYTPNKPQYREVNAVISNTFGFGGHNACLGFKKFVN